MADKELLNSLKAALKKDRNFLIVADPSWKPLGLVINKKPIKAEAEKKAKETFDGKKIVKGVVKSAQGAELEFHTVLDEEPTESDPNQPKRFVMGSRPKAVKISDLKMQNWLKEKVGLTFKAKFVVVDKIEEIDDSSEDPIGDEQAPPPNGLDAMPQTPVTRGRSTGFTRPGNAPQGLVPEKIQQQVPTENVPPQRPRPVVQMGGNRTQVRAPQAPDFVPEVDQIITGLKKVEPLVERALKNQEFEQRVVEARLKVETAVKDRNAVEGAEALNVLKALLVEALKSKETPTKPEPEKDPKFVKRLNQAMQGPHAELIKDLLAALKEAKQHQNWDECGQILSALEGLLQETASSERIDFDPKKFRVGGKIAQGGLGKVCHLEPTEENPGMRLCAKFILDSKNHALLDEEAFWLTKAGDHPNIPKCLGVHEIDGEKAVVTEYVEGEEMKATLDKLRDGYESGQLSHAEYWGATQYSIKKILQTVVHLEDRGMVHCDLKPENILIDKSGEVKVIDLGGAANVGEKITQHTERWAPKDPQERINASSLFDVFAVGKIAAVPNRKVDGITSDKVQVGPKGETTPIDTAYEEFLAALTDEDPNKRPNPAFALTHPFLTESLLDDEQARRVLESNVKGVRLPEPRIDAVLEPQAWQNAIELMIAQNWFDVGKGVMVLAKDVRTHLERLQTKGNFADYSRERQWKPRFFALGAALNACKAMERSLDALRIMTISFSDYISSMKAKVESFRRAITTELKLGPPEITEKDFTGKWNSIQSGLENNWEAIKSQLLAYAGYDIEDVEEESEEQREKRKREFLADKGIANLEAADACCEFTKSNISGALKDFDKALAKNDVEHLLKKGVFAKQAGARCRENLLHIEKILGYQCAAVYEPHARLRELLASIDFILDKMGTR